MIKVTNNAPRKEGIHTKSGIVYLNSGETRDLDVTDAGLKLAKRLSFIGLEGVDRGSAMQHAPATGAKMVKTEGALEGDGTGETLPEILDRDDLKVQAGELNLEYARNITTEKLKELIDAALAE